MAVTAPLDQAKVDAFAQKVFGHLTGFTVTAMVAIGDELGLFKDLAAHGPATSAELAARTHVHERYAREWLGAVACAGYLDYDPRSTRFTLPPEHAPALAQEGGLVFFGGVVQEALEALRPYDQLVEAFRRGGGVPPSAFRDRMYDGMSRFPAVGSRTCWSRSGFPPCPTSKPSSRKAPKWPTSAAAKGSP